MNTNNKNLLGFFYKTSLIFTKPYLDFSLPPNTSAVCTQSPPAQDKTCSKLPYQLVKLFFECSLFITLMKFAHDAAQPHVRNPLVTGEIRSKAPLASPCTPRGWSSFPRYSGIKRCPLKTRGGAACLAVTASCSQKIYAPGVELLPSL